MRNIFSSFLQSNNNYQDGEARGHGHCATGKEEFIDDHTVSAASIPSSTQDSIRMEPSLKRIIARSNSNDSLDVTDDNYATKEAVTFNNKQQLYNMILFHKDWKMAERMMQSEDVSRMNKLSWIKYKHVGSFLLALYSDAPLSLIKCFTSEEIGFIPDVGSTSNNVLHSAFQGISSVEVLSHIVDFLEKNNSRKKEFLSKDDYGRTVFHLVCLNKELSSELIHYAVNLINEHGGGKEIFLSKDKFGWSPLHCVCRNENASPELISQVLNVMERYEDRNELICSKDKDGCNILHCVCSSKNLSYHLILQVSNIIMENCESSWEEVFYAKDERGRTAVEKIPYENYKIAMKISKRVFSSQQEILRIPSSMKDYLISLPKIVDDKSLLQDRLMKQLMNARFVKGPAFPILMMDFYVQVILVIMLSFFIERGALEQPNSKLLLTLLMPCLVWLIFREIVKITSMKNKIEYIFRAIFHIVDITQMIVISIIIASIADHGSLGTSSEQTVLLIAIFIVWLRLLYVIGNLIFKIAVFNKALIRIFGQLIPFLVTTAIAVVTFAHVYHFVGPDDDKLCTDTANMTQEQFEDGGWTCSRLASYMATFTMLLGGEYRFLEDFPYSGRKIISMMYAFVIGIILLNIIIAVISLAFQEIVENSEKAFWTNRYEFLVGDVDSMVVFINFLLRSAGRRPHNSLLTETEINESQGVFKFVTFLHRIARCNSTNPMIFLLSTIFSVALILVSSVSALCFFLLGILSFGLLWPIEVKAFLFFGPAQESKEEMKCIKPNRITAELYQQNNTLTMKVNDLSKQNVYLSSKLDDLNAKLDALLELQNSC